MRGRSPSLRHRTVPGKEPISFLPAQERGGARWKKEEGKRVETDFVAQIRKKGALPYSVKKPSVAPLPPPFRGSGIKNSSDNLHNGARPSPFFPSPGGDRGRRGREGGRESIWRANERLEDLLDVVIPALAHEAAAGWRGRGGGNPFPGSISPWLLSGYLRFPAAPSLLNSPSPFAAFGMKL